MAVTKEEALKKWCPMSRIVAMERKDGVLMVLNTTSFNRGSEQGSTNLLAGTLCVGEACMMFMGAGERWTEEEVATVYRCGLSK